MCAPEYNFLKVSLVLSGVVSSVEIIGPLFLMEIVNDRWVKKNSKIKQKVN